MTALIHGLELAFEVWKFAIAFVAIACVFCGVFWWRFGIPFAFLFALIQTVSAVMWVPGWFVVGGLAIARAWHKGTDGKYHWPAWAWIFDDEEDGVLPAWYWERHLTWPMPLIAWVWCAFRNSVNNLRYVPGVSKVGRPFYKRLFTAFGKPLYVQAGWNQSGFPVVSAGTV